MVARERKATRTIRTLAWRRRARSELPDPEDLREKQGSPAGMDFLVSPEPWDPRVTAASAPTERRDSRVTRDLRVVRAAPANPGPVTWERLVSVASPETPASRDYRASRVSPDREDKCFLVPYLVRLDFPVCPVDLEDQATKVSLDAPEDPAPQGSTGRREREETPGLEASQDLKVSPDPEEIQASPEAPEAGTMEPKGRTVFPAAREPRASRERCLEPRRDPRDRTVYPDSWETKACRGLLEDPDRPVVTVVRVSPG